MDMPLSPRQIEQALAGVASLVLAAAAAFAASALETGLAVVTATAAVAFVAAFGAQTRVPGRGDGFALPEFAVACFDPTAEEECRRTTSPPREEGELLLDDVLAAIGPESRVLRLFDRSRAATPGELCQSIDRHLQLRDACPAPPDASRQLSDALRQLRRSLR